MEDLDALRNAPEAAAAKAAEKDFLYQPALTPRAGGVLPIRYQLAQAGQTVTFELRDASGKLFKKVSSADSIPDPVAAQGGGRGFGGGGGVGAVRRHRSASRRRPA